MSSMNAGVYYSASRKRWVNVTKMTNYHLVNALAKGDYTEPEGEALKAEILRRLVNENKQTARPKHTPEPWTCEDGLILDANGAVVASTDIDGAPGDASIAPAIVACINACADLRAALAAVRGA